tara:strand:+ start:1627 stop:1941 length:315 start_codon:yes stop_codon:yes gene_type:complete
MIRSIRIALSQTANDEVLQTAVSGTSLKKRTITEIWFQQIADTVLRGYVDSDRIVDVHSEVDQADVLPVPVDLELADGQEFKVGILEEAGAAVTQDIVVFYKEE